MVKKKESDFSMLGVWGAQDTRQQNVFFGIIFFVNFG